MWFLSRCTDLLGKGMVGGGLGTVGIGMGRGPVPGMWTPAAVALWPSRELLPSGSAGRGFWGGLGFSKSWRRRKKFSSSGLYCVWAQFNVFNKVFAHFSAKSLVFKLPSIYCIKVNEGLYASWGMTLIGKIPQSTLLLSWDTVFGNLNNRALSTSL